MSRFTDAASASQRGVQWLPRIAGAGAIYFLIAILALHVLVRDHDPITQMMSEYALSPFGYLLSTAFLAWGVGYMALAQGLRARLTSSPRSVAASVVLAIAGLSMFLNGIIPCDPGCGNTTPLGIVHSVLSFPFFFGSLVAILLLLAPFEGDPRWRPVHRAASVIAACTVVAFVVFFAQRAAQLPLTGVTQRLVTMSLLVWFLFVVNHLRTIATGPRRE